MQMTSLDLVRSITQLANENSSIRLLATGWDRTVQLRVSNEEFRVQIRSGLGIVLGGDGAFDLSFTLSRQTLDRFVAGRLAPVTARILGLVQSTGSIPDILRFAAILTASVRHFKNENARRKSRGAFA